jgi:hypothetical protein
VDKLSRWSAHLVDLRTLFSEWERRRILGKPWTRRFREIHSACMFTLCIENGSANRYLIGFQQLGVARVPIDLDRLFDGDIGEIEDCDILLVDDPKTFGGPATVLHHRCQLVSYLKQPSTSEVDWVKFLETRKLKIARDDDLRLVIHVEQEGLLNYCFLSAYLNYRKPRCPYSQVFVFAQVADCPRRWSCIQLYPGLAMLPDLDEATAKNLLLDREQYNARVSTDAWILHLAAN